MAITRLFNTVNSYAQAAINASAAELLLLDVDAPAGDTTVTFPASATVGQVIGIQIAVPSATKACFGAGPVDARPFSLQENGDCALWSWDGTTWQSIAQFHTPQPSPEYTWTWADATARTAQAITSADLGAKGYQEDMQLGYQCVDDGSGGVRWGRLDDPRCAVRRYCLMTNNAAGVNVAGIQPAISTPVGSGTSVRNASAGTNRSTRMARLGLVTGAAAGSQSAMRLGSPDALNNPLVPAAGFRSRVATVLVASANMRWNVMGFGAALQVANNDPNVSLNTVAMGRNAQANVQIYCNDGAGTCTEVDCGASFPAATSDEGYELEVFTANGSTWVAQVTRLNTGDAFSTTFAANVPAVTNGGFGWWVCNNTDAVAVAADCAYWIGDYFVVGP